MACCGTGRGPAEGEGAARAAEEAAAAGAPVDCYVLFDSHTAAMALFQALKQAGVGARISPTPRLARTTCGVSLLVDCEDRTRIEAEADAGNVPIQAFVSLPRQIDPSRDKYC